jgi:hypothetical protein
MAKGVFDLSATDAATRIAYNGGAGDTDVAGPDGVPVYRTADFTEAP